MRYLFGILAAIMLMAPALAFGPPADAAGKSGIRLAESSKSYVTAMEYRCAQKPIWVHCP